ncbi:bifunctional ADP-heptose synthase [Candidatus Aminicenantes bacterium AC-335-B20]|jgi:rfaE bifunctional protein kinase chain/domain|nr:bifunctional ADP-heptose synthase [SCandidatus Aminicenantes bacterium Aminicenantia_JdfR_composite]MCP2596268.1 bifunctional ADP-heptose synthase [Candidatus Aminicenantes bacterium AC-335-G13]MCP2597843.1 bifunctional ADP-heptose synthase [Candidatus Aminicenantes bacterium AC-335-L06]MCP2599063.1 bifunctional ADP-heptose synthase [Candidatus Aminicenantes bacterium AC-335-B20]MCP2605620.1 bifunctional ADP-heptose synthase [Candidatus Aminicenantes bacterium AC-335-O07]
MNINFTSLLNLIENFKNKKIAVWGDFILDEYIYTLSHRVSREAPVLILKYQATEYGLGGAGNSVNNIKTLGGIPLPVGILGEDEKGNRILDLLKRNGIETEYLIKLKNYSTPAKARILAGGEHTRKQQVLRIDYEDKLKYNEKLKSLLLSCLLEISDEIDALLISDYNYLTVNEDVYYKILPKLKELKKPISLDSRFKLLNFKEVTIATPNEPEVSYALNLEINDNEEILKKAGKEILRKLSAPALLITRGYKGMTLFEKGKEPFSIPIYGSDEIVDVTGAGDTVISTYTLALTAGADFREAAYLSNYAAGLVVMKKGAATVSQEELKKILIKEKNKVE